MELLLLAIAPAIAMSFFVLGKDKHHPEPPGLLWKTFFFGVLSVIPTLVLSGTADALLKPDAMAPLPKILVTSFVVAALCEEFAKFLLLRAAVWKHPAFDERVDGIIYGAMVGLGFATLENILYVFQHGTGTGIMRAFTAVPGHALDGVAMGFFLSQAKFAATPERQRLAMRLALFVPVWLHGVYDTFAFSVSEDQFPPVVVYGALLGFVLFVIYLWRVGLRYIREHQETDLAHRRMAGFDLGLGEIDAQDTAQPPSAPRRADAVCEREPRQVVLGYILAVVSFVFLPIVTGVWAIVIGARNCGTKGHAHGVATVVLGAVGTTVGTLIGIALGMQ